MADPNTKKVRCTITLTLEVELLYSGRLAGRAIREACDVLAKHLPASCGPNMYDSDGFVEVRVMSADAKS